MGAWQLLQQQRQQQQQQPAQQGPQYIDSPQQTYNRPAAQPTQTRFQMFNKTMDAVKKSVLGLFREVGDGVQQAPQAARQFVQQAPQQIRDFGRELPQQTRQTFQNVGQQVREIPQEVRQVPRMVVEGAAKASRSSEQIGNRVKRKVFFEVLDAATKIKRGYDISNAKDFNPAQALNVPKMAKEFGQGSVRAALGLETYMLQHPRIAIALADAGGNPILAGLNYYKQGKTGAGKAMEEKAKSRFSFEYTPQTQMQRFVFGEEPIRSIDRMPSVNWVKEKLQKEMGVSEDRADQLAQGLALPVLVLMADPRIGIAGGEAKLAFKNIAKSVEPEEIVSLLRGVYKGTEDDIQTLAPRLVNAKTEKEVEDVMRNFELQQYDDVIARNQGELPQSFMTPSVADREAAIADFNRFEATGRLPELPASTQMREGEGFVTYPGQQTTRTAEELAQEQLRIDQGFIKPSTLKQVEEAADIAGISKRQLNALQKNMFGQSSMKDLQESQADELISALGNLVKRGPDAKITIPRTKAMIAPKTLDDLVIARNASTMVDIGKTIESNFKDNQRITEKVMGPERAAQFLRPWEDAKSNYANDVSNELTDLEEQVVKKLGIGKKTQESADVQRFGEGVISEKDLVKKYGEGRARDIIAADKFFRRKYDEYIDTVNETLKVMFPNDPSKLIEKRKDYYRHFSDLGNSASFQQLRELISGGTQDLSPSVLKASDFIKRSYKKEGFMKKRLGQETTYDAVGGFLNYVPAYSHAKNINPQIQRFRKFHDYLVDQTEESKHLNNYLSFLKRWTDKLSGESGFDKILRDRLGDRTIDIARWVSSRLKQNQMLANFGASVAQVFNLPQAIARLKGDMIRGVGPALRQAIGAEKNSPITKSTWIKERYLDKELGKFNSRLIDQPRKFAEFLMRIGDEASTKLTWNAAYERALRTGAKDPIRWADAETKKLVGGRGIGERSLLESSNWYRIINPFQLEATNFWYVMQDAGREKDYAAFLLYAATAYLGNEVAERVRGSDVVFDPMEAMLDAYKAFESEDDKVRGAAKAAGRVAGEVLSNVPGGGYAAKLYPEYGIGDGDKSLEKITRKDLFGENDPSRFGSGSFITKAVTDPVAGLALPFGGQQVKKTLQGAKSLSQGASNTKTGKTRFEVEKTPTNVAQGLLFGQYATKEGREYTKGLADSNSTSGSLPTVRAKAILKTLDSGKPLTTKQKEYMRTDKKVRSYVNERKKLTPKERELKDASVDARVKYINLKAKKMSSSEKARFTTDLKRKGIWTSAVTQRLKADKKKSNAKK